MSIERALGLRNYLANASLTSNNGVLIETTAYAWGTGQAITIEPEKFKDYDEAHRLLAFRKWMYLGATFLTMSAGATVATSMLFPQNELNPTAPAYVYFLAGLAIRTGINTLIESMKAKAQLEAIGG